MSKPMQTTTPIRHAEQGYILVAVIFLLALLTLTLAIAAPKVAKQIQRDRELETMQRGKQYIRAIKLYYKKFGAYPPTVDALVKTNNIRYLRKKYTDPTTGKELWKPVLFGLNKAPTAMGFFGQPIAGSTIAGIRVSGGNTSGGSALTSGSTDPSTAPSTSATGTAIDSSSSSAGSSGLGSGGTGSSSLGSGGTGSSSTGLSGQTFGGAGIIGFSPNSPKQSILVYKKKNHYNEWEFVYDPLSEQTVISSSAGAIGQPAGSTPNPTTPSTPTTPPTTAPVNPTDPSVNPVTN
jgi:type II secretory pathway pseudopilin PulG